jgi:hypothetical protein
VFDFQHTAVIIHNPNHFFLVLSNYMNVLLLSSEVAYPGFIEEIVFPTWIGWWVLSTVWTLSKQHQINIIFSSLLQELIYIINLPILFDITTVAIFFMRGLLDKVMNLVTGKNCRSTLPSSANIMEIGCGPYRTLASGLSLSQLEAEYHHLQVGRLECGGDNWSRLGWNWCDTDPSRDLIK